MKAYKWVTSKKQAFHDGHQFKYGWNCEDGVKDGTVCRDGGFHITTDPRQTWCANTAKFYPDGSIVCHCYEVYYRKKDILGQEGKKVRVKTFKILRKKPYSIRNLVFSGSATHRWCYIYTTSSTTTNTRSSSGNYYWLTFSC